MKLLQPEGDDDHKVSASDKLWGAVKTVIIADLVMSVDNVLAIAGAAQGAHPDHQLALVIFGLVVSIPIIVGGSQLVLKLMERFPVVITLGGMLLGWIAGQMAYTDPAIKPYLPESPQWAYLVAAAGALMVLATGKLMQIRQQKRAQESVGPGNSRLHHRVKK